ncbi:MAG: hypothetical protein KDB27_19010 [Planctomycetales bacterium]|nr:hypothetical protein [Planctomycetales bacterium]
MTDDSQAANPYDQWRTEIRSFCDDVRRQLTDIRDEIEHAVIQDSPNVDVAEADEQLVAVASEQSEPRGETEQQKRSQQEALRRGPSKLEEVKPEATPNKTSAGSTEDRLQNVRRQLETMLSVSCDCDYD